MATVAVVAPSMNSNPYYRTGIPYAMGPAHPRCSVGVKRREIRHPCENTSVGHANRSSMAKVYEIVTSQHAFQAEPTAPAPTPQARNDAPVAPASYHAQHPPIGTPRAPLTPPLSPRSVPQDMSRAPVSPPPYSSTAIPGHNFPGYPHGAPVANWPQVHTPPQSPHFAPAQGFPFPPQPPAPGPQYAPGTAPLKPAIRSRSHAVPHPNAAVQRSVSWADQPQQRTARVMSSPQFISHDIPQAGSIGRNPDAIRATLTPQMAPQQFQHQYPQHPMPQSATMHQPATMPRQPSFAPAPAPAAPGHPHAAPQQAPVPTPQFIDPSLGMRPYSYNTGFDFRYYHTGQFQQEIQMLNQLTESKQDLTNSPSLRTLAQLTPYKLEAFKYEFQLATGKNLHAFCMGLVAKQDDKVKTLVAGLTLGPAEFDWYLLKNAQFKKMEDDLVRIFFGKDQDDLKYLNALWQQRENGSLASSIPSLTANKNLQYALRICTTPGACEDPSKPVDAALVHRDVNRLEEVLKMTFATTTRGSHSIASQVLDALLLRNNSSIHQIALYFKAATGCKLDEMIRRSSLDDMTKKIAVHAVRTAQDPTYRDIMALKDVVAKSSREEDLAIRVCRGHWYGHHWKQIQAAWMGIMGAEFKESVLKMQKGLFRDLIMAMTGPSS